MAQFDYKKEYDNYMKQQYGRKYNKKAGALQTRRSICLLVSTIIAFVYLAILAFFTLGMMAGAITTLDDPVAAAIAGGFIGSVLNALLLPHAVFLLLGLILNFMGWFSKSRGLALTAAILYTISLALMPFALYLLLVPVVLSYVGFATMDR